ncbi:hypothetical protein MFMK1_002390 [Metallumcola ferriviriculae]|uniref:Uncharacterized protein n=1 Tax=Metallumcola ferriviriculae TaxID=3039180 RepID=A0AAU0UN68_9FIRM|nr:hypothetical protein MFMK1_002390 [Desulfitibacteraceae bacterium MK1]
MPHVLKIGLVTAIALFVNIPLGVWRCKVKKFSFWWFLAVHLSVPLIIYLRIRTGVPIAWIPVTIGIAVLGQYLGGMLSLM